MTFILMSSLTGCISVSYISTSSGVNEDLLSNIPTGAKIIIVDKMNVSADSLSEELVTILISRGQRIFKDDKARHYLTTEGKDIGQSTLQRITINVIEKGNNSQLRINTEWKAGTEATAMATAMSGIPMQSDWQISKWEKSRSGIAFAESEAIANEIKNGIISYDIDKVVPSKNFDDFNNTNY
jgi:hypothetical protein